MLRMQNLRPSSMPFTIMFLTWTNLPLQQCYSNNVRFQFSQVLKLFFLASNMTVKPGFYSLTVIQRYEDSCEQEKRKRGDPHLLPLQCSQEKSVANQSHNLKDKNGIFIVLKHICSASLLCMHCKGKNVSHLFPLSFQRLQPSMETTVPFKYCSQIRQMIRHQSHGRGQRDQKPHPVHRHIPVQATQGGAPSPPPMGGVIS